MIPQAVTPTPTPMAVVSQGTPPPPPIYNPPALLYPPEGALFKGAEDLVILQWASVGILDPQEFYHVEFIMPTAEGRQTVDTYLRSTAWRVPEDYFPPASVSDRECAWRVGIVRQIAEKPEPRYKTISEPGLRQTFTWLAAP
jgi:hypothetical protein